MEIFALEDHELPTVQLILYIRGGSVYDPPGKEGLASIAMQTIRLGGTAGRGPDEVERVLEFVGGSLEMGSTQEYQTASLSLLRKDLDLGLDLLFQLLRRPALDRGRFEIIKKRARETLEREREDPLTLGLKEYPQFVFGPGSWWGRHPTSQSIESIGWEDVKRFHEDFLRPDRMIVAVAGDFSASEIFTGIRRRVDDWKVSGRDLPPIPPLHEGFEKGDRVIHRKGLNQSTILIGHLGSKRDNPDKYPLLVLNDILGGGAMSSRLGEEIRSSAGKAYSIWSDFGFGRDYGLFQAIAQTSIENKEWVIDKMKAIIRKMVEAPDFSREEITRSRQAILRSLFFTFETRFAQVRELAKFRLLGYPDDYLKIFQKEIRRVSKTDLERVARKYLHPEGLKTLTVTNAPE